MGSSTAKFATVFAKAHPQIIARNRHLASIMGAGLKYVAGGYVAGQVMARNTSTGLHEKYVNGGSNGTGTAVGILFEDVAAEDFASTGSSEVARIIIGGEVYKDKLTSLDATAIGQLGAKTIVVESENILKF